jgi:site-specific DNA-methyltransferase (adenine-specific)
MPQLPPQNALYYGDNLEIIRQYLPDECVDLIYLDPPFNSSRNYNVLFKDEGGKESEAQVVAFQDTWHWTAAAARAYEELVTQVGGNVGELISALRVYLRTSPMMAYLVMMGIRLVELYRVLKPSGSIYLHCDPTASHYLKMVMDTIFGVEQFRNEIIWKRTSTHSDAKRWAPVSDTILFYTKSRDYTWNPLYVPYDEQYIKEMYRHDDHDGRGLYQLDNITSPNPRPRMTYEWMGFPPPKAGWRYQRRTMQRLHDEGRIYYPTNPDGSFDTTKRPSLKRYLNEMPGRIHDNVWTDINPIGSQARERLGYPTQKPIALLRRIIEASSNEGDLVLDPFAGCGTTIAAAEQLKRRWIGVDITHLAIALLKYRLRDMYGLLPTQHYRVFGEPRDLDAARHLASENRYQFQWWALSLIEARPLGAHTGSKQGKQGADQGVDGVITFLDTPDGKAKRAIVQVKSGKVGVRDIRDLIGTVEREKAQIGIFITLEDPTKPMEAEANGAGFYHSPVTKRGYPRIQIRTISELLAGTGVQLPRDTTTFKQAAPPPPDVDQGRLLE